MSKHYTPTVQRYAKALYALEQEQADRSPIGFSQLAERSGVTAGTLTTMLKRMASDGLIDYQPRRGVRLKRRGKRVARDAIRRHLVLGMFLAQTVAIDWLEACREAEMLSNFISDKLLTRLDVLLGSPIQTPDGDPIPISGAMRRRSEHAVLTLSQTRDSQAADDWVI